MGGHSDHTGRQDITAAAPRTPARERRLTVSFALAVVLVVIDQLTKSLALQHLSFSKKVPVLGNLLSLQLFFNIGATMGMGSSHTWVISLLAIAACVLLVWCILRTDSLPWSITAALALAGAAGNLIDRVHYAIHFLDGWVVDFLNYGWSIGNVADIYLTLAAVIGIILLLRSVPFRSASPQARAHDDDRTDERDFSSGADPSDEDSSDEGSDEGGSVTSFTDAGRYDDASDFRDDGEDEADMSDNDGDGPTRVTGGGAR